MRVINGKNVVILILTIIILFLAYRVFDLGVTLTYSEQEISNLQKEAQILEMFQRAPCLPLEKIPEDFMPFEKEGFLVIGTLKFVCTQEENSNQKIFLYKDENL